jgi:hypothetical protein
MRKVATCAALALFLSGCATTFPDATVQDKYACDRDVALAHLTGTLKGVGLYNECMRARGLKHMCGSKECPAWAEKK